MKYLKCPNCGKLFKDKEEPLYEPWGVSEKEGDICPDCGKGILELDDYHKPTRRPEIDMS